MKEEKTFYGCGCEIGCYYCGETIKGLTALCPKCQEKEDET